MRFSVANSQIPEKQSRGLKALSARKSAGGYILISLMLFITLLTVAALAVLPEITHQIQRDREEEMIHRAVGYSRAIRKYYRKLGRYPARIEELENTNQMRFLRKRYKDPLTGKDFKLVRLGDPALASLGLGAVGQAPLSGQAPGAANMTGQGTKPGFVGAPGGGIRPAGTTDANTPQVTGLPDPQNAGAQNPPAANDGTSTDAKVDSKSASSSNDSAGGPGGEVFGGGAILGVASTSKATTIREFNKKNHYNEWLFIYDPTNDRGGPINGPAQPNTGAMGIGGVQPAGTQGQTLSPGMKVQGAPPPPGQPPTQEPPEE
jgi:type II secretory pathway pseudopilin PulG